MTSLKTVNTDRLDLLQTFIHIVEAGSLSAAAHQLGTTQPTISRRLQLLERSLGLRLLQRSTHAMALTEDGERCYTHAKTLLESWQAIEADLRGLKDEPRGHLRVVAPNAFGQDQLIGPLAEFLQRYPQVTVEWHLQNQMPDFISEHVDCALRVGEVHDPNLVAIKLAEVPRVVIARPGLWGLGAAPRTVDDLAQLPWVALQPFYRDEVELQHLKRGQRHRFPITPRLSVDSLQALRNAVHSGIGIGICSTWFVADDLASGQLVQLTPDWIAAPLPVYIVYPHASFYPARLRSLVQLMKEHLPRMTGVRSLR